MSTPAGTIALTGSDGQHHTGVGVLRGLCVRETAGAAARIRVHDGTSTSGTVIAAVTLAANEASVVWLDDGVRFATGLYVDVITGAVEGSLFV